MTKPDPAFGVKCFSIAGRLQNQRQRCLGMTEEERKWRAQWLKDQVLSPEEPKFVPEYYRATTNIFRRLYKTPFNNLEKTLKPIVGHDAAFVLRHAIGKGIVAVAIAYLGVYYAKYHTDDFTTFRTVELYFPRRRMYPDHPDYPNYPEKLPFEYYDEGFYSSVLCQDVEIEEPPPPPPPPPPVDVDLCPALSQQAENQESQE